MPEWFGECVVLLRRTSLFSLPSGWNSASQAQGGDPGGHGLPLLAPASLLVAAAGGGGAPAALPQLLHNPLLLLLLPAQAPLDIPLIFSTSSSHLLHPSLTLLLPLHLPAQTPQSPSMISSPLSSSRTPLFPLQHLLLQYSFPLFPVLGQQLQQP